MNGKHPKNLILEALINHPEGLTMLSLAEAVGLHRHTTTKYLYELIGAGLVYQRKIGPARLCYLKEKTEENEKERKPLGVEDKKFGGKSQIRFIAIFLLLGIILVSTTVIASNFLNETFGNTSPTGELVLNQIKDNTILGTPQQENKNVENIPNDSTENNSIIVPLINNDTSAIIDTSKPDATNETSPTEITKPANTSENQTINNETFEMNDTEVSTTINATYPIEIPPIEITKPILNVKIKHPEKITRGSTILIKATIENTGSSVAKKIVLNWILPKGFEIISEEGDCQDLEQNASCTSVIAVQSSFSAELGVEEIKLVVSYGT